MLFAAFPAAGFFASAESLPKIWLDAGHGGSDPGATNGDRHEADDNLRVAIAVGAKLEAIGFEVGYTRKTDVAVELGDRVPMASDFGADFVISFHRNSRKTPIRLHISLQALFSREFLALPAMPTAAQRPTATRMPATSV